MNRSTHKLFACLNSVTFIAAVCLLVGCYSKSFQEPAIKDTPNYSTSRTFSTGFNSTWNALLKVLENAPIARARKESGVVLTDWIYSKSDRLFSGYDTNKIPYKVRYKMLIRLRPDKRGTTVVIENKEQFYTDTISSGGEITGSLFEWRDTKSSTVKEKKLLDLVEAELTQEAAPSSQ